MRLIILYFPVLCIIQPANNDPVDMDMLFGRRCSPRNVGLAIEHRREGMYNELTSLRGTSQIHDLKPHRKEVHNGKVACSDEEVGYADHDWYTLLQEGGCQHRFAGEVQLDDDEGNEENNCEYEGCDDFWVGPLQVA